MSNKREFMIFAKNYAQFYRFRTSIRIEFPQTIYWLITLLQVWRDAFLLVFPPYGMILRYNGVFRYYKLNSSTPIAVHAGTKYEFYRVWALIYNT